MLCGVCAVVVGGLGVFIYDLLCRVFVAVGVGVFSYDTFSRHPPPPPYIAKNHHNQKHTYRALTVFPEGASSGAAYRESSIMHRPAVGEVAAGGGARRGGQQQVCVCGYNMYGCNACFRIYNPTVIHAKQNIIPHK